MARETYDQANWDEGRQRILNGHPVPHRHLQISPPNPIPVHARIMWEQGATEWIDTTADAWSGQLVLVLVSDARVWIKGAWLNATDIERR